LTTQGVQKKKKISLRRIESRINEVVIRRASQTKIHCKIHLYKMSQTQ